MDSGVGLITGGAERLHAPAPPPAAIEEAPSAEVALEKTRLLFRNAGAAQTITVSGGLVLLYNLGGFSPPPWATAWWLAAALVAGGRYLLARRCDAIVVLGAQVLKGGRPSPALRARVEHGVELYRRGLAPRLLFSGGVGRYPPAEAELMRRLAIDLRVPEDCLLVEAESRDTAQNARLTAALMRERGLRSATLVSDPYHLLRARQHFRRQGLEVATSPVPLDGRGVGRVDRLLRTLREAFALLGSPAALLARRPR